MRRTLLRASVAAADTEETLSLPANLQRMQVFVRTNAQVRVSFETGVVAAADPGGRLVSSDTPFNTKFLDDISETLYYACDTVGAILEVAVWT